MAASTACPRAVAASGAHLWQTVQYVRGRAKGRERVDATIVSNLFDHHVPRRESVIGDSSVFEANVEAALLRYISNAYQLATQLQTIRPDENGTILQAAVRNDRVRDRVDAMWPDIQIIREAINPLCEANRPAQPKYNRSASERMRTEATTAAFVFSNSPLTPNR